MAHRSPRNLSASSGSNEAAAAFSRAPPALSGLFVSPVRAADTRTTRFGHSNSGGYYGHGPAITMRTRDSPEVARRKGRGPKRRRPGKNVLPAVRKDEEGEVYFPLSDAGRQQALRRRQDGAAAGRQALPAVARNSVGNIYLSNDGWLQQRPTEPANSVTTPSSLVFAQIDAIYNNPPLRAQPAPQSYFSNSRPPPRRNSADERAPLPSEEDSVRFALSNPLHTRMFS